MHIKIRHCEDRPAVTINTVIVRCYRGIYQIIIDCKEKRTPNESVAVDSGDLVSYHIYFRGERDTVTIVELTPNTIAERDALLKSYCVNTGSKHGAFYHIIPKFPTYPESPNVTETGRYQLDLPNTH